MSIFSKIIAGEIPSYKIRENELFLAFLDIAPLVKGHVLVIPKKEIDKMYDLPNEYLQNILTFAKPICYALEKSTTCTRVAMSVIGLEVPHAHLHLIPINNMSDSNFSNKKLQLSEEEFKEIQQSIIKNL